MRDKRMKGFWMKYKGQIVMTLLLLLLVAAAPMQTYYEREFAASDLEIPDEAASAVSLSGEEDSFLQAESGYQGTVAAAENVTLQRGTYRIQAVTWSEGSGNRLEIYSPRTLNADNTEGKLLTEGTIASDGGLTELTFEVTESLEDVSFLVWYEGTGDFHISSLYLTSTKRMYQDPLILMGLMIIASLLILMLRRKKGDPDRETKKAVFLLGAAVLVASLPLCFPYVLDGNDLYYQFNRILGIQEALKSGQFPVKLHSTLLHGYGYGSSIFYPELFLYFPAALGCLGMSLIGCYRLLLFLVHATTAFVSYRSFSGIFRSREKGLPAAILYVLSIYRLLDLYTRAAVGEGMAMIFIPLVMWGLYELFLGDEKKWYLAALGFTGIMQCHILSTELAVAFGALFGLSFLGKLREKKRLFNLFLAGGVTLLLNLGLVLPILQHAAYPFHVFSVESTLSWWTTTLPKLFDLCMANPTERMYAGMENGGEMPCTIGLPLVLGLLAFFYVRIVDGKKEDSSLRRLTFVSLLALLGIYASTNYFPWDKIQAIGLLRKAVTTIQLPWRCLAFSTALLCPVTVEAIWRIGKEKELRRVLFLGMGMLCLLCSLIYVNRYNEEALPRYTYLNAYQREQAQVDLMYFIDVEHSNSFRIWNREDTFVTSEGVTLGDCTRTGKPSAAFSYEKDEGVGESYVDLSFTWYPDYQAKLSDGTRLTTAVGDGGVLRVYLPEAKSGRVEISYQEPWYIPAGRIVSILTFLSLLFGIWKIRRKTRRKLYDS